MYVITNFSRTNEDEVINPRFRLMKNGTFIPDPFHDEVLIAIDTPEGMVVLLGCSHPGVRNMLGYCPLKYSVNQFMLSWVGHIL